MRRRALHFLRDRANVDREVDVEQWDRLFLEVVFWIPWYDSSTRSLQSLFLFVCRLEQMRAPDRERERERERETETDIDRQRERACFLVDASTNISQEE